MIKIVQRCDGCGDSRPLKVGRADGSASVSVAALADGWREVLDGKHLCVKCIRGALA